MTQRVLGPSGSRRRRRLTLWIPLIAVLALIVPSLVLGINLPQPGTGGTSNEPSFEVDGNKLSEAAGKLDWADGGPGDGVIVATRNASGTCT